VKRRFEFRLARLRRVREINEQVARAARAAAERESRRATALLEQARGEVEEARRCLSGSPGPLQPQRILHSLGAIETMLQDVGRKREGALTREAQARELAEAWREREVDRRALEQLENRARDRHRAELERRENAETDEQNLMREIRRRRRLGSDSSEAHLEADTREVSS
jgi:flagellar export protein FliJ